VALRGAAKAELSAALALAAVVAAEEKKTARVEWSELHNSVLARALKEALEEQAKDLSQAQDMALRQAAARHRRALGAAQKSIRERMKERLKKKRSEYASRSNIMLARQRRNFDMIMHQALQESADNHQKMMAAVLQLHGA
jgi:hypothetical protein